MKRRDLLIAGTGSLALLKLGAWTLAPLSAAELTAAEQLDALARSMVGGAVVGRAFMQQDPPTDARRHLLQRLRLRASDTIDQHGLAERLTAAVSSDFENARTLNVDGGWVLSETEVWLAALHVRLLGHEASAPTPAGFEHAREEEFVQVDHYGPETLIVGRPLEHPNLMDNVMWFTAPAAVSHLLVFIDGQLVLPTVNTRGFSIRLSERLVQSLWSRPGTHPVWIYDPAGQRRQVAGVLTVRENTNSGLVFCEVQAWGAQQTRAGAGFNVQPDGSSALWVQIACAPDDTVVILGDQACPTTVRPADGLITARVTDPSLYAQPGELPLSLHSAAANQSLAVGSFVITP